MGEENKEPKRCKVKLVLAINEPIEDLIRKDKLRKDLFFRIRRRLDFKSLHELLMSKNYEERSKFITNLLKIFAWKHCNQFNLENFIVNSHEYLRKENFILKNVGKHLAKFRKTSLNNVKSLIKENAQ